MIELLSMLAFVITGSLFIIYFITGAIDEGATTYYQERLVEAPNGRLFREIRELTYQTVYDKPWKRFCPFVPITKTVGDWVRVPFPKVGDD